MTPWFERWPELLEWELERFGQLAVEVTVDEQARARGQLVLTCEADFEGKSIPIEVRYPSEYPELPPLIFGEPGLLERHQHRFGGNFCLLPRPLDDWPAKEWGAADLVVERLSALLKDTEAGPEAVRAGEAPMPEPVSTYYLTAKDATVLMAPEVRPGSGESGTLWVRRPAGHVFIVTGNGSGRLPKALSRVLAGGEPFEVPWIRLPEAPPQGPDPATVIAWLRAEHSGLIPPPLPAKLQSSKRLKGGDGLQLYCLVFPEEGPGVGEFRDGYLFVGIDRAGPAKQFLLAAQPLSEVEHSLRRPELAGMAEMRALVLGAGTLGGDIAVELAKGGLGDLEVIDFDTYEFGNTMRHRLGTEFVGQAKAQAVAQAAQRANPFCSVTATDIQLGDAHWEGESPLAQLQLAVASADVVVEASGSHQLAGLLARVCREQDKPMVSTWLTEGFYGAEVVRIIPGKTSCWPHFAAGQKEGELRAEAGPPSQVAPQGCSHPTTSGAGFDAVEAAAIATRLVVQTLAPEGGYPDCEWDHAVINFRRGAEDPDHPRFGAEKLVARDDCEQCLAHAGSHAAPAIGS